MSWPYFGYKGCTTGLLPRARPSNMIKTDGWKTISFLFEVVPFSSTCQFSLGVLLWQVFFLTELHGENEVDTLLRALLFTLVPIAYDTQMSMSLVVRMGMEWIYTCTYHSPEYTIDVCDPIDRYRSNMVITNILHGSSSAMGLRKQGMAVSNLLARFCFPHLSWSEKMTQWHDVWRAGL